MLNTDVFYDLSNDHIYGLIFAELIKDRDGQPAPLGFYARVKNSINFYMEDIINHFNKEEEMVFNVFTDKDAIIDRLISQLKDEHNQMLELIQSLDEVDNKELVKRLDVLGNLVENHIRKEERELFPRIAFLFNKKSAANY